MQKTIRGPSEYLRYFYETLLEYADHGTAYFWGNPNGTDSRRVVYWPDVLTKLLVGAYRAVGSFEELRRQAVKLQHLQDKYSAQIDPSKDLPEEFMDALIQFRGVGLSLPPSYYMASLRGLCGTL